MMTTLAALLAGYVTLLAWGPRVASQNGLGVQVVAHIAREVDRGDQSPRSAARA